MSQKQARFLEIVFGVLGFGLIAYSGSWVEVLGLFFVLWGNNIGHSRKG